MTSATETRRLPAVFTSQDAGERGITKRQLYAWRDEGLLVALGRGLFMKAGTSGDPDLIEIAARAPDATICLVSALADHSLTDLIPDSIHVAIPRDQRPPRTAAPVTWHRFDPSTFSVDRAEFAVTRGFKLGRYGAARSVVDAFRVRHLEGTDLAIEALRRWLRRRGNQPATLLALAQEHFPAAEKPIRAALEVLL